VQLSQEGLPADVQVSFSPNPGTPTYNATVTITVPSISDDGIYTLIISGAGGGDNEAASMQINIVTVH